jgi:hypothetical protein
LYFNLFPLPFARHFCLRELPHLSVCMFSLYYYYYYCYCQCIILLKISMYSCGFHCFLWVLQSVYTCSFVLDLLHPCIL